MERSPRLQNHSTYVALLNGLNVDINEHTYIHIYTYIIGTRDGFSPMADPTPVGHVRRARSMDGFEPLVVLMVQERAHYL